MCTMLGARVETNKLICLGAYSLLKIVSLFQVIYLLNFQLQINFENVNNMK